MIKTEKYRYVIVLFLILSAKGFSIPGFQLDSMNLATVKQKLQDKTASERTRASYKQLISKANKLLSIKNPSVMDKTIAPPTGNKHDYLSISRYWWPNPETPNRLPWIRKDGKTNPETQTDAVDRKRLGTMTSGVNTLCLAYYFSDDERYAKKAVSMIGTWFLDDATRMNPHLQFAQSVPGNSKGRSSGVLDGRSIAQIMPDAINILSKSSHWTESQNIKMSVWLNDYLTWLTESELGKTESKQKNNHGSWCKYQVAALALYLGNTPLAKETIEAAIQSLDHQIDKEGKQTHEIERTRSFFYSCFNLEALTNIAVLGNNIGLDMWNYKSEDNKSLTLAVNYLAPVITGEKWLYPDIHGVDLSNLVSTLVRISKNNPSNEISNLLSKTIAILIENEKVSGDKNDDLEELIIMGSINL